MPKLLIMTKLPDAQINQEIRQPDKEKPDCQHTTGRLITCIKRPKISIIVAEEPDCLIQRPMTTSPPVVSTRSQETSPINSPIDGTHLLDYSLSVESHVGEQPMPMQPYQIVTRASHSIVKPNSRYALSIATSPIPRSPKQTLAIPEWKTPMIEEFQALVKNITRKLVPRNMNDNIIITKWIFQVKQRDDGFVERLKVDRSIKL